MLFTPTSFDQKTGQTHAKLDSDLAVVGTCNVSYDLVVGGANVLDELALRAPLASPTFTGTTTCSNLAVTGSVTGISKAAVQLGNDDNATDASKPVSTSMLTALNGKEPVFNVISPLVKGVNLSAGSWEVKVDPTADMTVTNLTATGSATVSGDLTASSGSITASILKTSGTPGLKIRTSANSDIVKFLDTGITQTYGDLNVGGNLSLSGSLSGYSPFWLQEELTELLLHQL